MPSRFLLSPQAASAVAGLLAEHGGVRTEPRRIASPPGSESPTLFDCRFSEVSGALHLFCYLPPDLLRAVFLDGKYYRPSSSQMTGSAANPWADLGAIDTTQDQNVYLGFELTTARAYRLRWRIFVTNGAAPSGWTLADFSPIVPLAFRDSLTGSAWQLHRGSVSASAAFFRYENVYEESARVYSLDGSIVARIPETPSAASPTTLAGPWYAEEMAFPPGGFVVGSDTFYPRTISIDGTSYTVLAKS